MKMKRIYVICMAAAMTFFAAQTASAQSKTFKMGQWSEIQHGILKELNASYVDSLPVDRIMRAGIDAMLKELDPYTIYVPEEENENFQMMISNTYGGIGAIIKKMKGQGVIINEPYMGSPAHKAGLSCGDEILEIDGEPTTDFTASAGGGVVKIKMNGRREVLSIDIAPEIVDPDDIETLSDIMVAAVNEAIKKVNADSDAEMQKLTGGMGGFGMPGLF